MKNPSVLAFERKLDPSDALFAAGHWEDWQGTWTPVLVREKSVRGTVSNRLPAKAADPAKLNASIEKPNPQTIDVASLPESCDTLRVHFTLRILGGVGRPSACNVLEYQQKLISEVARYKEETKFSELARRYAFNLANGRFLWRNRLAAEEVLVQVSHVVKGEKVASWEFDAMTLSMNNFEVPETDRKDIDELASVIATGLQTEPPFSYCLLDVYAFARAGNGQEVFPSQELIMDKGKDKSKTLYAVNNIAGMHSQKIGNALRTIDTWYPDGVRPIAVEPYGSVTSLGTAYRQPKEKCDFYTLLDNWMLNDKEPEAGNRHFVVANIIRGGVFGSSDKEKS